MTLLFLVVMHPGTWRHNLEHEYVTGMCHPISEHEDGPQDIVMAGCSATFFAMEEFLKINNQPVHGL